MFDELIVEVKELLLSNADENHKKFSEKYFKYRLKFYGVKVPILRKSADEFYRKYKNELSNKEWLEFCNVLSRSKISEEVTFGYHIILKFKKSFGRKYFDVFSKWISRIDNWAHADDIATHHISFCLRNDNSLIDDVILWRNSDNLWKRRISIVCLIPLVKDEYFRRIVFEQVDKLLPDEERFVNLGVGWTLRESGKVNEKELIDYLEKNCNYNKLSKEGLRYAIEKLDEDKRKEFREKRGGKRE